ncbi:tubulin-like doman-containing protein [Butyrivibrio sp. AE2032]|uniref:tubulin-like doman-containing protein n=1 Tax=Butyrivibrio sp. AE2032 TaxID=1458463 RepID=UPI000557D2F8|nr:tubulin-like doman-containing protein [Butyrivibrio sp. AE2032]
MYQKLLLNKQGGIVDVAQQMEQDNCAVICIGLGGTGVDCLKNLKAKIYNRVLPDDPKSEVPHYDHIRFLAVDSDENSISVENSNLGEFCQIDRKNEFFPISCNCDISEVFAHHQGKLDEDPAYRDWLEHTKIDALSALAGAGGVPQLGRYLLMERAKPFLEKVISELDQARAGLTNPYVYIHIFSGISGGTGSGTFLDVCYLVREAVRKTVAKNCFLCGYFFMPDVNCANGLDTETEQYVKNNGFTSLQELDYCMNFERNGDKWSQYYKGLGLIESRKMPVDICHLISATTSNGDILPDGYDYAMNVVTDYFLDFLVKTNNKFTMESHISNYNLKLGMLNKEFGATYKYCVLGAAAATLPFKDVLTYLAAEFFKKMSTIVNDKIPTENNLTDFVNRNSLSYTQIYGLLTQGADLNAFPLPVVDWRNAQANDNLTVTYFTDIKSRVLGKIQENYSSLSRKIDDYTTISDPRTANTRSIITRIFEALKYLAADPSCGPFYAAKMLRSTISKDLVAVVDGYIKTANDQREQENAQEERLYSSWEQAQREFFASNTNSLNGDKRYKKYANATRNLTIHRAQVEAYTYMYDLLKTLRSQLTSLSSEYMDLLATTVKRLMDTFDENRRYLAEGGVANRPSYEIPIATINDVMPDLLSTVAAMNMDQNITNFMQVMTSKEGVDAWINSNEDKISMFINHYFTDVFSAYSQKTMTSYLQTKYNTQSSDQLIDRIENDLMHELFIRANPMFWTSHSYNVQEASKIGYITYPATSLEVTTAALNMENSNKKEFKSRDGAVSDRISIMRCYVGVPLFGYQGIVLYENNSVESNISGQHIYEGKTYRDGNGEIKKGRDWRELASPTPIILMNATDNNARLMENARNAKLLYLSAVKHGIIQMSNNDECEIHTINESFMDEFRKVFEDGKRKSDDASKLEAKNRLVNMSKNIIYDDTTSLIPNDCSINEEQNKENVRIDHFIISPCLQAIVKNEMAKHEEIDAAIDELTPKVNILLEQFESIMFAGIVSYTPPFINFENEFGETIELNSPEMSHSVVPLYQSYLSFSSLDEDLREEMCKKAEINRKAFGTDPEIKNSINTSCQTIWDELKDLKTPVQDAAVSFPDEIDDLKDFLKRIKGDLSIFAKRFGIKLV